MSASAEPNPEVGRRADAMHELLGRRRLLLMLGVLLVEFGIFSVGLMTPLSDTMRQTIENQTSAQFSSVPTASAPQLVTLIFTHNLPVALVEMVPVLGAVVFVSSIYVTGLAAQVGAVAQGYPGQLGAVILLFPYALVEFSAYAVAVGAGVMLVVSWRSGRLGRELRAFVLEMVAVPLLLLLAALMETATEFFPLIGLALWIPTGLAVALLVVYSGRRHA